MSTPEATAYEFDLNGNTNYIGSMEFTPSQTGVLELVAESLQKPIARCNFAHEERIATNYTQEQFRGITMARQNNIALGKEAYRTMVHQCLCPAEVRKASPLCAHADAFYQPDPYGNELRALMHLRILHREQWTHWLSKFMVKAITSSDSTVANNRYNPNVHTLEWRTKLQDRDANMLEQKRTILVECTQIALNGRQ